MRVLEKLKKREKTMKALLGPFGPIKALDSIFIKSTPQKKDLKIFKVFFRALIGQEVVKNPRKKFQKKREKFKRLFEDL